MVEGVDEVHAEFQTAFGIRAESEILLERHVEEMLRGAARVVEGSRRAAERAFGRTHERRRVEVRLTALTDRATATPAGIEQRHAWYQIGTNASHVSFDAEPVVIAQNHDHRNAALNAPDAAEAPAADHRINPAWRLSHKLATTSDRQIPDPRRAECVFDVEERNRTIL